MASNEKSKLSSSVDWVQAIPLFLEEEKLINSDDTLACVTFPDLWAGLAYLGGGQVYLGAAVLGWKRKSFTMKCPKCSALAFVLRAGGSPLSGSGSWGGICPHCGLVSARECVTGLVLSPEIKGRWSTLGFQPLIQKGSPWRFDFKRGSYRNGELEEIRLPVPTWQEFISSHFPSLAQWAPGQLDQGNKSFVDFGMKIRGKVFTLPVGGRE